MDRNIELRMFFHDQMEHFDFYHLFFNKKAKEFYQITEGEVLTETILKELNDDQHELHHQKDGGFFFGYHIVRVYDLCGKWVVFFDRNFYNIKTNNKKENTEGIIVFNNIAPLLREKLMKQSSYDGRLSCYNANV